MTPDQFMVQLKKQPPAPAYLFLGPESYQRGVAKKALIERALKPENRADGFTKFDLNETSLEAVLDDARSFSLFSQERLIWIGNAESAMPRTRANADRDDGDGDSKNTTVSSLNDYLLRPMRDTVLVFEASRFDFSGDDKAKLERVEKFYAGIRDKVEFRPYTIESARHLAQELAKKEGLQMGTAETGLLIEALGGDAARIATEIEKLSLYAGKGRKITPEEIARLVPDAQATTIFALVSALGRKDRLRSLDLLDTLVKEGEYLPLALTFLATQFRLALVAREAGLRNSQQIQAYFQNQGIRMWRERADQVMNTVSGFDAQKLQKVLLLIHDADKNLRDTRPDDRIVMEELIIELT